MKGQGKGVKRAIAEAVSRRELVLTEGAVIERLRRDSKVPLDPHVANTSLLYTTSGRDALRSIWRSYLDVARAAPLPIVLCAPTWRATPERLQHAGLPPAKRVCADAVEFTREVANDMASPQSPPVFVAGLMGCRGDAYRPQEALGSREAEAFHTEQAAALAQAGVDLILAATLPAASEALGLARAIASTDVPFIMGFVPRADGKLLDGQPMADVVHRIDDSVRRRPLGYAGTCIHPDLFAQALAAPDALAAASRFVALQGNGSRLPPHELDGRGELDSDDPVAFAASMAAVRERFRIGLLGGCCGTDQSHLAAIVAILNSPARA